MKQPWKKRPQFPIIQKIELGDGNWDKSYVEVMLNEDGTVTWDKVNYVKRYKQEQQAFFGKDYSSE